jgi:hypothetical protein
MSGTPKRIPALRTGADDITRSLGSLMNTSFRLAETTADVMETELATVIRLSERVRDQVISAEFLENARKQELPARFRRDAHAIVDIVADVGAVFFLASINFLDNLTGRTPSGEPVTPAA